MPRNVPDSVPIASPTKKVRMTGEALVVLFVFSVSFEVHHITPNCYNETKVTEVTDCAGQVKS